MIEAIATYATYIRYAVIYLAIGVVLLPFYYMLEYHEFTYRRMPPIYALPYVLFWFAFTPLYLVFIWGVGLLLWIRKGELKKSADEFKELVEASKE
jgi:H+/Cl- antiporter ClcA